MQFSVLFSRFDRQELASSVIKVDLFSGFVSDLDELIELTLSLAT